MAAAKPFRCAPHWVEIYGVTVLPENASIISDVIDSVSDFCDDLDSMMNILSSEEIADILMKTVLSAAKRQGGE